MGKFVKGDVVVIPFPLVKNDFKEGDLPKESMINRFIFHDNNG